MERMKAHTALRVIDVSCARATVFSDPARSMLRTWKHQRYSQRCLLLVRGLHLCLNSFLLSDRKRHLASPCTFLTPEQESAVSVELGMAFRNQSSDAECAPWYWALLAFGGYYWIKRVHLDIPAQILGFPGGPSGKEPTCQYRRCKRLRFNPWVGKIPWGGPGHPLQCSCLENPMDRETYSSWDHKE